MDIPILYQGTTFSGLRSLVQSTCSTLLHKLKQPEGYHDMKMVLNDPEPKPLLPMAEHASTKTSTRSSSSTFSSTDELEKNHYKKLDFDGSYT